VARRKLEDLFDKAKELNSRPEKVSKMLLACVDLLGKSDADGKDGVGEDDQVALLKHKTRLGYDGALLLGGILARIQFVSNALDVFDVTNTETWENKDTFIKKLQAPGTCETLDFLLDRSSELDWSNLDQSDFQMLYDGMKHYDQDIAVADLLWRWMNGKLSLFMFGKAGGFFVADEMTILVF
jgi:hypothetical protein